MNFLFLILISSNIFAQSGSAPSYESFANVLQAKNYQFKLSNAFFQTSAYFDYDGNKQNIGSLDSFSRLENELTFRRNFSKNFEAGLFGRFRSQTSDETDSNGMKHGNSVSGIESLGFAFRHTFPLISKLRYTAEAGARFATYSNTEFDAADPYKELALGDGVHELFAGPSISYTSNTQNVLTGRLHLNFPTSKQTAEFKYDVQAVLVWEKLALLGGAQGIYSLNQDKYSDDLIAKPRIYNGATRMYNSINRAYLSPYLGLNLGLSKFWRVEGKVSSIVAANSYDEGSEFTLNIVYNSDKEDLTKVIEKNEKFKTYNIEATVIKLSPRGKFLRIDKGIANDVEKGMKADIFDFDYLGGNKLLASGIVIEVTVDAAVIKVMEVYSQTEVNLNNVVRLQEL